MGKRGGESGGATIGGGGAGAADGDTITVTYGGRTRTLKIDIQVDTFGGVTNHQIRIGTARSMVGNVTAVQKGDSLSIKRISVNREAQGKGLGSKLYDALITHARKSGLSTFTSDKGVSRDAQRRWKAFAKKGKVTTRPHTVDPQTGQMASKDGGPVFVLHLK